MRAGDRPQRDDQLVVAQLWLLTVLRLTASAPPLGSAPATSPSPGRSAQLLAQRDHHVAWLQRAPAAPGSSGVYSRKLTSFTSVTARSVRAQALQGAGGVEAAEPAACDHHLPGHAYRIGCGDERLAATPTHWPRSWAETSRMRPPPAEAIDAHTHLGLDEDGRSLAPEQLLAAAPMRTPAEPPIPSAA